MEEIDYSKKIRTCEKLGAKKFQKILLLFDKSGILSKKQYQIIFQLQISFLKVKKTKK